MDIERILRDAPSNLSALDSLSLALQALDLLDQRLRAVETAQGEAVLRAFQGAWLPARTYPKGSIVQNAHGLYVALSNTAERPGESSDWRLMVRSR